MKNTETVSIQIIDEEMYEIVDLEPSVIRIGGDFQFTEGPAWIEAEQYLLFSDIPANILYRWSPAEGVSEWRNPSHNANGNTVDLEGRLITCEHGSRRVTRTEKDGSVTVLAESYQGKKLNSPNDVVVTRDGTIWFTDPPYGIQPDMAEQSANHVFRLNLVTAELVPVVSDFSRPNGLCFSPDEQYLYIADSDRNIHHVRRFKVKVDNSLQDDGIFTVISPGIPDGMRVDLAGRLYCTAGDGIQIFRSDGTTLGKILTPKSAANCIFGVLSNTTYLFMTARNDVWGVALKL